MLSRRSTENKQETLKFKSAVIWFGPPFKIILRVMWTDVRDYTMTLHTVGFARGAVHKLRHPSREARKAIDSYVKGTAKTQ